MFITVIRHGLGALQSCRQINYKHMKLLYSIMITVGAGAIAGWATASNIGNWYAQLYKPSFNPPNRIFGPVWTILYILMGIALYLVWKTPPSVQRRNALLLFAVQLFLNFCWSFLFFYFHLTGWALADIILLWTAILATMFLFSPLSPTASWLLLPYISWVSFATILNLAIHRLN
jgi:benzodiazapine receptor